MHTGNQSSELSHHSSLKRSIGDSRTVTSLRQQWSRFSFFLGRHTPGRHPYIHANGDIDDASIWTASTDETDRAKSFGSERDTKESDEGSTVPLLSSSVGLARTEDGSVAATALKGDSRPFSFSGVEVEHITILTRDGQTFEWSRPRSITEWPEAIRKQIWRKAVVNDNKLMICDCEYCLVEDMSALQPALAQVSESVRKEVLSTFYNQNQFIFPIGHKRDHGVRDWLDAIGQDNRRMLQHVELAPVNADAAIKALAVHYRLAASVYSANTSTLDLTAEKAASEEGTTKTNDSSRPSDKHESSDLTVLHESEEASINDSLLDSACSTSSITTVVEPKPPQLDLRRPNGDEWGDPRWSFAGKFDDHLVKRLASCK